MDYQRYFLQKDAIGQGEELKNLFFLFHRVTPESLCPFAAHAIFPYVFGFDKGSWFRWMKSKNSVIVQCPNPAGCVSFKITRESPGNFFAEVIGKKNECRAGHAVGDKLKVAQADADRMKAAWCYLNRSAPALSVVSHSRLCRYYQAPGHIVAFADFVPPGFCVPAYYVAYPYALSLLYDGVRFEKQGKETVALLSCPNDTGCIQMQVGTKSSLFSFWLNLLEKTLRALGTPRDVLDKSIEIKVIASKGTCPKGLAPGHAARFNLRNRKELCPALFYTLFPFLALQDRRISPYWADDKGAVDIHCPDAAAAIVYRLTPQEHKS